jgi:hypothetical protein
VALLKLPPDQAVDELEKLVLLAWRTSMERGHGEPYATDLAARFGHLILAQIRLITRQLSPTRH